MRQILVIAGNVNYHRLFSFIGKVDTNVNNFYRNPSEFDLVVFTGGEDVHPDFYSGIHTGISQVNMDRDRFEKRIFDVCLEENVKMTGICRGFQFINVMSGGFMYQHIERHAMHGVHTVRFPYVKEVYNLTSTHHQLVGLPTNAMMIGYAYPRRSDIYIGPDSQRTRKPELEIESAVFPHTSCMGVQFHPEMIGNDPKGVKFYLKMMEDFMNLEVEEFSNNYGGEIKWQSQSTR